MVFCNRRHEALQCWGWGGMSHNSSGWMGTLSSDHFFTPHPQPHSEKTMTSYSSALLLELRILGDRFAQQPARAWLAWPCAFFSSSLTSNPIQRLCNIIFSRQFWCLDWKKKRLGGSSVIEHLPQVTWPEFHQHTHIHTHIHRHMYTHMHRHMYTHTCTYTRTHTHAYTRRFSWLEFDESKAQLLFAERASEVKEKESSPKSCVLLPYVFVMKSKLVKRDKKRLRYYGVSWGMRSRFTY